MKLSQSLPPHQFSVPTRLIKATQALFRTAAPPPKLTISAWADRFRRLSSEASAEPGAWNTNRAAYQRGIMDALSETGVERIVLMTSAQVGKTEVLNNVLGFHIHQDPAPILVLQPTLEMAETWSKDRLAPMLRDTPALSGLVADPRSRDSGNTITHKRFNGGHLTAVGANSAAGLASRPIRIVLADEVDRYPPSAGTEGDPLSLAVKRTTTFWNRRIVMCSTPTVKGFSRIEAEWERSDQRRYFVSCPHCAHEQHLVWANVRWPEGKPEEACYHCEDCGAGWTDAERRAAIRWGKWIATAPGARIVGFHLNELYSPWSTCADVALAFLVAKRSPQTLKTWINTSLGETWEEDAERLDSHSIMARREEWDDLVPDGVLVVTCGVDVQDDRLEVERVGWGADEESWSIEHRILYGDPSSPDLWAQLDEYLLTKSIRKDGTELFVAAACVDSGGHHTQAVYRFVKDRFRRRVYAIKGVGGPGKPVWPKRASKNNKQRVNLFLVGVDAAKDAVYARLHIDDPGPGYCHFPKKDPGGRARDVAYFEQLTAEVVQTKYSKKTGFPERVYVLPGGKRNEALDLRVYAYAALLALNVRWGVLLAANQNRPAPRRQSPAAIAEAAPEPMAVEPVRPAAAARSKQGGWLGGRGRPRGWLG
ncbi:MAG: phage terminase large subunit family protein [Beijerinckiaceae bacterium]|nr:phage terminase large subunit family protein [Beijerinckiaceae bacterium]